MAKLIYCPFCGDTHVYLIQGYKEARGTYHWPKITCGQGHTFRFYSDDKDITTAEKRLIEAWNTRFLQGMQGRGQFPLMKLVRLIGVWSTIGFMLGYALMSLLNKAN